MKVGKQDKDEAPHTEAARRLRRRRSLLYSPRASALLKLLRQLGSGARLRTSGSARILSSMRSGSKLLRPRSISWRPSPTILRSVATRA